jgi:hypothetical protein
MPCAAVACPIRDLGRYVGVDRVPSATGSRIDLRLLDLLAADQPLAVTDVVLMEVLAGARDDAHRDSLRRLLARFDFGAIAQCALLEIADP